MSRREDQKRAGKRARAREWAEEKRDKFTATAVQLPDGVEWIKLDKRDGVVTWDFMPYVVGGKNKEADRGTSYFMCIYGCHRFPTPDGRSAPFVCAYDTWKRRCAGCEWARTNGHRFSEKDQRDMRSRTRILWLVNDRPGDKSNPVKVFESNMLNRGKGFGEQIKDAIKVLPEGDDETDAFPFDLRGGYTARMTVKEDSFEGKQYALVTRIDLIKRKYDYPESLLKNMPCLDECLIEMTYEELQAVLEGGQVLSGGKNEEDDDEDDAPPRRPAPPRQTLRDGSRDDDDEDDDEDDAPPARSSARPSSRPPSRAVDDDEDEDEEDDPDDDEDDAPPPPRRRR